ncbi:MAG: hypothetical protein LBQ52_05205 [Helicobacteraceae bacterium]|jgi:hypothetical protein|nr:hypothetical protein [Helicobacteraceae bacterium]
MKNDEAKKRLRFIKELERFLSRASNYLNKTNADWAGFIRIVENAPKLGETKLYNSRYSEYLRIASELIARANKEPIATDDLGLWLRGELNRAEKNARQKTYNRQKTQSALEE